MTATTTLSDLFEKLRRPESDRVTDGDITRAIKRTLREAFPSIRFAVRTSSQIAIKWTDDGPTVDQVEDALIVAGAEAEPGWNGERRLRLHGSSFWFDRYNAGERAADQEDRARRTQEREAQQQRKNAAVRAAVLAKRDAMPARPRATPAACRYWAPPRQGTPHRCGRKRRTRARLPACS